MYFQPYFSIVKNLRSMLNFSSAIDLSKLEDLQKITFEDEFVVSEALWNRYKKLVEWNQPGISPIFPYAILTHLQIELATHPYFPSKPTGILHKREIIKQFGDLKLGKWHFKTRLKHFVPDKKGYEASIVTELFIEQKLVWTSETLGLIKTSSNQSEENSSTKREDFNVEGYEKGITIQLQPSKARQYAWLSGNIDPIHFSGFSAKLMGHPASIMHGMWNAARIVSALAVENFENTEFNFRFISGFYLPGKATIYSKKENNTLRFALHDSSKDKPFLLSDVVFGC
jgi:hypothetical protein